MHKGKVDEKNEIYYACVCPCTRTCMPIYILWCVCNSQTKVVVKKLGPFVIFDAIE